MNLSKLFGIDIEVTSLEYDSREVREGSLFFCLSGLKVNGHDYAEEAVSRGAVAVVAKHDLNLEVPVIVVDDVERTLSMVAVEFFDYPTKGMNCIALTGTDGKTSTSLIIKGILDVFEKTGYIGTNGVIYGDYKLEMGCTTPFPPLLFSEIAKMRKADVQTLVMEATSHGLSLKRVEDIKYDLVGFTNIKHEHLDFHKTLDNYRDAKMHLLDLVKEDGIAILNIDDDAYFKCRARCSSKCLTYGKHSDADYRISNIYASIKGLTYNLTYQGKTFEVFTPLIGDFSVYNTCLAIAIVHQKGYDLETIIKYVGDVKNIDGRSIFIDEGQDFEVFLDFAHTSYAMELILGYLRKAQNSLGKKIITVVGSAGERDVLKRPLIGEVVTRLSDYVIFTNEDPRTEDPNSIIADILDGVKSDNYEIVLDRKQAIERAFKKAVSGDVVALLGKGAEEVMEFDGYSEKYSEEEVARTILKKLNKK